MDDRIFRWRIQWKAAFDVGENIVILIIFSQDILIPKPGVIIIVFLIYSIK